MNELLRADQLRVGYGSREVLHGIDLCVGDGEFFAVLGPSGCGKTTLLRSIAGFERPTAGTISLAGKTVSSPDNWVEPEKRRVTIVPQEASLFPHLKVRDNVAFGLARRSDRRERVRELLAMVGLAGYDDRYPSELSGGEQQRVALARALAPQPLMVLFDEPFSALDAALRVQLRDEVRQLLRAAGTTAVLVTHDQDEALSLADRVAVMRDGMVVQIATPQELYNNPIDLEVATFVGTTVVLPGEIEGSNVSCALGSYPLFDPMSGPVVVVFRPEQLRLGGEGVAATVVDRAFHGHDALVRLVLDGGTLVCSRVAGGAAPVAAGDRVRVAASGPPMIFTR